MAQLAVAQVVAHLSRLAFADIRLLFEQGTFGLLPLDQWPDELAQLVDAEIGFAEDETGAVKPFVRRVKIVGRFKARLQLMTWKLLEGADRSAEVEGEPLVVTGTDIGQLFREGVCDADRLRRAATSSSQRGREDDLPITPRNRGPMAGQTR